MARMLYGSKASWQRRQLQDDMKYGDGRKVAHSSWFCLSYFFSFDIFISIVAFESCLCLMSWSSFRVTELELSFSYMYDVFP